MDVCFQDVPTVQASVNMDTMHGMVQEQHPDHVIRVARTVFGTHTAQILQEKKNLINIIKILDYNYTASALWKIQ